MSQMAETINPQGTADFDWEALQLDGYNQIQRSEMSDRYEKTLTSINEREVIQGTVALITKKEVIINIGYKSEGVVAANEFRYNADLKIGDLVDVYVECREDKTGQLVVSHKTARMHSAWLRVNDVLRTGEIITGYVKCRTKGGLIVDVFGIEAFLPGSQIDVKPIRDYDVYVGKNMEFKVVKINEEFRNVVVSHKALIEAELEEQKKQIISGLEKGQVLEGVVKNITTYGVFIDLGGVDGLIHITDLSWGRVSHPEEMLELDQKINVVILDFDDDKKRIALGLKQLQPHPWDSFDTNLNVGDKVSGKVVVMADYGAFIELATGVEGLIHVSEMSWSQHLRSAQDFMSIGDTVEAVILTLDREDRKMSLGIKQSMPDPWNDIETKYAVGSKHSAKVRNFTNFGVFVELEEGVDGLIHISDLSWQKKIKHPSEFCKVGEGMDVIVLEIDRENRRISLGHKQLEENPWDIFESTFADGSIHSGTIIEMKDKSGIVSLPYGVEGICPAKHLKKEDGQNAKVEETLDFKVIEFNKELKKIVVSHTRTFEEGEDRPSSSAKPSAAPKAAKAPKKAAVSSTDQAVKAVNENTEKSTLGDFDALAELKEKMEKGE
jgi:small subunit ribosomal protein S1